jgi:hypothetical protein
LASEESGKTMALPNNASISGSRPVSYVEDGSQWFIPLGFITLVSGKASVNTEALAAANISISNIAALESLIDMFLAFGELKPVAAPPPQPAFALSAKQSGRAGNQISVTVKQNPPSDGAPATFDLTIRLTERFAHLELDETNATGEPNPNFLETKLADSVLITVEEPAGGYALPKEYPGTAGNGSDLLKLTGGDATTESSATAEQPEGGAAFTVKAREIGIQGNNISVVIIVDTPTSFSMTVQMTETYQAAETNEKLPEESGNPKYIGTLLSGSSLVTFRKSGDTVRLPADRTYNLTGGENATTASTLVIG